METAVVLASLVARGDNVRRQDFEEYLEGYRYPARY
jgi:hypothetical protein